jgi:hypothetical protein
MSMVNGSATWPFKLNASGYSAGFQFTAGVCLTLAGATTLAEYATTSSWSVELVSERPNPWPSPSDIAVTFRDHVANWKAEMRSSASSSFMRMIVSPHYQRIIGMGLPVVPLLLAELEVRPDHWGWALEMITGENPVPPEAEGKLRMIAQAWVDWGRVRRLV